LLLRIVLLSVLCYVLYRVRVIVVVVLMSAMLTFTTAPAVDGLVRTSLFRRLPRGWRRPISALAVFILLAAGIVGMAILIVQPLVREVSVLGDNWNVHQAQLVSWLEWVQSRYGQLPPEVREWLESQDFRVIAARGMEQVQHALKRTVESGMLLVELILIPVLAYSFLTESRPIKSEFLLCIPRDRARDAIYLLRQIGAILQSYAVGQLILALIAGVTVWVMLTALGVRYALAMAIIAAVTRVIPVVGPLLGGLPILLLCALQGWDKAIVVIVGFMIMHLVESKVVMPRLIGYRIKLHPAVVIIVLLIGAEFFGMWGMFLAAPVAAIAKVLFQHFYVRPHRREPRFRPPPPPAPVSSKELEVERPAIAGVRGHSGAH